MKQLGLKKARLFWQHPFVMALKQETDLASDDILRNWPEQTRYTYCNSQNLLVKKKEPARKILAHLLQGEESAMMEALRVAFPRIVSLEFDGFTSDTEIPKSNIQQVIHSKTGHHVSVTTRQYGKKTFSHPEKKEENQREERRSKARESSQSPLVRTFP